MKLYSPDQEMSDEEALVFLKALQQRYTRDQSINSVEFEHYEIKLRLILIHSALSV